MKKLKASSLLNVRDHLQILLLILTLQAYTTPFFYYIKFTGGGIVPHPRLSISNYIYFITLKFVPEIHLVKWWLLVTLLTGSHDWCAVYRPKTDYWWRHQNWKWYHQSTSFIKKTYFQSLIIALTWETKCFKRPKNCQVKFQNYWSAHVQRGVVLIWKCS